MKPEVNLADLRFDQSARIAEIEQEISIHPILRHPFLEGLRNGEFSKKQIATWISQQYYFSTQFPRCLAALYARIEDTNVSLPLMRFLSVEHWGSQETSAHWKQFIETLRYFNQDVRESAQHEETAEYLNCRLNICLSGPLEEGLGAIALGHEYVNVHIFGAYLKGVEYLPDVPASALQYFQSHVEDEPYDYEEFKKIILSCCHTARSFEMVRKGALGVLSARGRFFDKLLTRVRRS